MTIGDQIRERLNLQPSVSSVMHTSVPSVLQTTLKAVELPTDPAFLKRYPHELSGGQQQRVVIAQAIIHQPALIIADEPTASLDPEIRGDIASLLRLRAKETGSALLLVTHDWPLLLQMCPRVYLMEDGTFVEEGKPEIIFEKLQKKWAKITKTP
jgi:ABC-type dipeptide/oligopeptide/nickel transport system ATPase component